MGKKNNFGYYDENGKDKTVYENWDDIQNQKNKIAGAHYVKFKSEEEKENFKAGKLKENTALEKSAAEDEGPKVNLKKVINNKKITKNHKEQLENLVKKIIQTEDESTKADSENIKNIIEAHKDVNIVVFADGSANKAKNTYESSKIGFGLVLIDIKNKKLIKYSYKSQDEDLEDIGWLLEGSNFSAEMIVAVTAMRLCEKYGYESIRIYQDYEGPAKYFSGDYKQTKNECGDWYIESSLDALENLDVQYIYIPSHTDKCSGDEKQKKQEIYKNQKITKVDFDTAMYFNDVVDKLASV